MAVGSDDAKLSTIAEARSGELIACQRRISCCAEMSQIASNDGHNLKNPKSVDADFPAAELCENQPSRTDLAEPADQTRVTTWKKFRLPVLPEAASRSSVSTNSVCFTLGVIRDVQYPPHIVSSCAVVRIDTGRQSCKRRRSSGQGAQAGGRPAILSGHR
ncbi:hypothetical protein [Bradyrhizobium sp. CCBAU 53421]|uniref:hypothetical protein n=1 Tax=Bradyrhizobium sp. CCBAU 53421 TaxID=1325120 RepID=UPI001FEE97E7|nr:hypothetical protein [Bradyrhizobium sp. CCBAU 53421]